MNKKIISTILSAVVMVGCTSQKSTESIDIVGKWSIEKAMGLSTEGAEEPAFINFTDSCTVNGNSSVNSFFGSYTLSGDTLTLSQLGSTKRMGASMEIEMAITEALNAIATVKTEEGKAYFFNSDNDTIMVLKKGE